MIWCVVAQILLQEVYKETRSCSSGCSLAVAATCLKIRLPCRLPKKCAYQIFPFIRIIPVVKVTFDFHLGNNHVGYCLKGGSIRRRPLLQLAFVS